MSNVQLASELYAAGNDTLHGGDGDDLLDGGEGQNILHGGNGWNSPQILDNSEGGSLGESNFYAETGGSAWSDAASGDGFNGGQRAHSAASNGDKAVWTFSDIDPAAYYDAYVTWKPESGAATSAPFTVTDPAATPVVSGPFSVDQTRGPADDENAGAFWRHLGVFQATSGTLIVELAADPSGKVLADAVRLVKHDADATTNLAINSAGGDSNGKLAVSYTITGDNAAPFTIGIYQSADGVQPTTLMGTIDVSDPDDLTGGTGAGTQHTVLYGGTLDGFDAGQVYLAKLDVNNEVYETSESDNISSTPLSGAFQTADGQVYALVSGGSQTLNISQDATTGDITVGQTTFQYVSGMSIALQGGGNTVTVASGVTVPVLLYGSAGGDAITVSGSGYAEIHGGLLANTIQVADGNAAIYAGQGGDTIIAGDGNDEIYGGLGNDTVTVGNGNNWVDGGAGNDTIDAGSGRNWIYGGDGDDWISVGDDVNIVYGGSGTNTIWAGLGYNELHAGSDTSWLYSFGQHDVLDAELDHIVRAGTAGLASVNVLDKGNLSNSNSYGGDYAAVDGYGGTVADWEFDAINSGERLGENASTPIAIYATWNPAASPTGGTQWAQNAAYTIYDVSDGGSVVLETVYVDQQNRLPRDELPQSGGCRFELLRVYNIAKGHHVKVVLSDASYQSGDMLNADAVVIKPIWPEVSIRTNANGDADANGAPIFDEKDDWLNSWRVNEIAVEGSGARTQVQIHAEIDAIYDELADMNNWHVNLPDVAGLAFWTDNEGGARITPDAEGNLITGALSSAGTFDGTAYVSVDAERIPGTVQIDPSRIILAMRGPGDAQLQKGIDARPRTMVDLDIDSDNNGYINTIKNSARRDAEDVMEDSVPKPITYFGDSPDIRAEQLVPIRLSLDNSYPDALVSFHYTVNLKVYRKTTNGTYTEIPRWERYSIAQFVTEQGTKGYCEYWVRAVGADEATGFGLGIDKIHVVLWDASGTEIGRDTVCLKVQNGTLDELSKWVVPNDWTISKTNNGVTIKTPMPYDAKDNHAVGPMREGTGVGYNDYNKGHAYTKSTYNNDFILEFDVAFDSRSVQPDWKNEDEQITTADQNKLGFVANSGVKIGPLYEPISGKKVIDDRREVNIIDVVAWVNSIPGGLTALKDKGEAAWSDDQINCEALRMENYKNEQLKNLLSGVVYNGDYKKIEVPGTITEPIGTGKYYYQILENYLKVFCKTEIVGGEEVLVFDKEGNVAYKNDGGYKMKVTCGAQGLVVAVAFSNAPEMFITIYADSNYRVPANSYLSLQSHWGSGVSFNNIGITGS